MVEDAWKQYAKPPITEAAVEFRLAGSLPQAKVEKAAKKLGRFYEIDEVENVNEFRIDAKTGKVEGGKQDWLGPKLSSADRTEVLALRKRSLIFSRLAPYSGWPTFRTRIKRDWEAWVKATGASSLSRVGMRYINRLDVPVEADAPVNIDEYLNVGPRVPDVGALPMTGFSMQVRRPLAEDQLNLILNTGTVVPPPLVGYASVNHDSSQLRDRALAGIAKIINRDNDEEAATGEPSLPLVFCEPRETARAESQQSNRTS